MAADTWITGVGVAVGGLGVLIGWIVSGTQRVQEKLTEERRQAYQKLLLACDAVDRGEPPGTAVAECAAVARFVGSVEMYRTPCIGTLVDGVGTSGWRDGPRAWFESLARLESQQNSQSLRRRHRRAYESEASWRADTRLVPRANPADLR